MQIDSKHREVMATVRKLRLALEDSQQSFATRLGLGIATVVRYELSRPPGPNALAKLEQVATAHGFEEYAGVFRRALTEELGSVQPAPFGPALQFKTSEEREMVTALLAALRKARYSKQAKSLRKLLSPIAVECRREAEFAEALETSKVGIVRLLKKGHSAEEVMKAFGTSAENVARALFERGDPQLVRERAGEVVALLLKHGHTIEDVIRDFEMEPDEVINHAHEHKLYDAISDYEEAQGRGRQ